GNPVSVSSTSRSWLRSKILECGTTNRCTPAADRNTLAIGAEMAPGTTEAGPAVMGSPSDARLASASGEREPPHDVGLPLRTSGGELLHPSTVPPVAAP